jgi:hypothetical protein
LTLDQRRDDAIEIVIERCHHETGAALAEMGRSKLHAAMTRIVDTQRQPRAIVVFAISAVAALRLSVTASVGVKAIARRNEAGGGGASLRCEERSGE